MHIARPLAALSAAALALTCLGSTSAVAAPSDRGPAPRVEAGTPASAEDRADLEQLLSRKPAGPRQARPVRLVARTSGASSAQSVRQAAQSLGLRTRVTGAERFGLVTVETSAANADRVQARLELLTGVRSVQRSTLYTPMWTPNDLKYPSQQSGMFKALKAPTAWDITRGAGTTIAILDGGFQATHPDLAGKVVGRWNIAARSTDVSDAHGSLAPGHGTATASVAAAATSNGKGIAGAAPAAKLLLVRVSDSLGDIYDDLSAAGIIWAADHGADVISMSYGAQSGSPSFAEFKAVQYAISKGAVLVASAGNSPSSNPNFPAGTDGVIAVGATNTLGTAQTSWSAYGSWVDVAAPGVGVPVAIPLAQDLYDGIKDGYTKYDGTSFSAPLVAGAAALLRAQNPLAPQSAITTALTSTAKPITTQAHGTFAHGLVQFAPALAAMPADPVITSASTPTPGVAQIAMTTGYASMYLRAAGSPTLGSTAVANGSGTGTISTWGLSGSVQLRATACAQETCELAATANVQVNNPAPVLTLPVDGSTVGAQTVVDVEDNADSHTWVKYIVDGTRTVASVNGTGNWGIDTGQLAPGTHQITAVYCTGNAETCDTAHPSAPVTITVEGLRPTIAVAHAGYFSPNGDSRQDSLVVDYTLDGDAPATIGIKLGETWVQGPESLPAQASGQWTWNGRDGSGTLVTEGSYTVVLEQTRQEPDPSPHDVTGTATAPLALDLSKAGVQPTTATPKIFYPYVDRYLDSTVLTTTVDEPVVQTWLTIKNAAGTTVRTITGSGAKSKVRLTWSGRTAAGKAVPDGRYSITSMVQDQAGNRTIRTGGTVVVSNKKLVYRTSTRTLTADGAAQTFYYDGRCTAVYGNARPGVWPTSSLEFVSRRSTATCPKGPPYYAFTENRFTLPTAVKYSTFSISTYGGGSIQGTGHRDDKGELDYLMRDDNTIGTTYVLPATTGSHAGPTVRAPEYLVNGNQVRWLAGTSDGNWYDIRGFTVRWSYYTVA